MSAIKESILVLFGVEKVPAWLTAVIRVTLGAGLLWLIYSQVTQQAMTWAEFVGLVHAPWHYTLVALVAMLMLLNWGIESLKWKRIVGAFQPISYYDGVRSVLSGVALAIVTPARIGEYGGRLVNIEKRHRSKALVGTAVSSLAQNIANISMGLLGVASYAVLFLDMGRVAFVSMLLLILPLVAIGVVLIYRLDLVERVLERLPVAALSTWVKQHSAVLLLYSSKDISYLLSLSFARYCVYTLQYVLLALVCGITADPFYALVVVSVIFLIQTGIPLPPMLSVLARGEVAIWVWSVCSTAVVPILTATFLLWFINLVIPAVCGVLSVWLTNRQI